MNTNTIKNFLDSLNYKNIPPVKERKKKEKKKTDLEKIMHYFKKYNLYYLQEENVVKLIVDIIRINNNYLEELLIFNLSNGLFSSLYRGENRLFNALIYFLLFYQLNNKERNILKTIIINVHNRKYNHNFIRRLTYLYPKKNKK